MSHHPPPRPPKLSALSVTAFVLSLCFLLPFVPLLGAILGIVAVVRHPPDRRGRGLAIAAIPVGFGVLILVQGLLGAISIPAFVRYQKLTKVSEAKESLAQLRRSAASLVGELGRFPVGETAWAPSTPCCEQPGKRCAPGAAEWAQEPWRTLGFRMRDRHRFQYRYVSDGQSLRLEARADLDCNGRYSSYRVEGSLQGGRPVFSTLEVEDEFE